MRPARSSKLLASARIAVVISPCVRRRSPSSETSGCSAAGSSMEGAPYVARRRLRPAVVGERDGSTDVREDGRDGAGAEDELIADALQVAIGVRRGLHDRQLERGQPL